MTRQAEARAVSVVVRVDEPVSQRRRVEVAWESTAPLAFAPRELDLGTVRPGGTATGTAVAVVSDPAAAGSVTGVDPPADPGLSAAWDADIGTLTVTLAAGQTPGPGRAAVRVRVAGGEAGAIRVPVRWEVADLVRLSPPALFLTAAAAGGPAAGSVTVRAPGGGLVIESATLSGLPWATAAARPTGPDAATVTITGTPPAGREFHTGTLTVEVSGPVRRTLTASVTVRVRPAAAGPPAASPEDPDAA